MGLTTNMVAYWKLDETSGNRADSVGANTLTDVNSVASAAGKIALGAQFDGAADCLSIADNTDLSVGNIDFSVGMWIKTPDFTSTGTLQVPLLKGDGAGTNVGYGFYFNGSGVLHLLVRKGDDTGYVDATSSVTMSVNTWYWVLGYHDSVNDVIGIQVDNGTAVTAAITVGVLDDTRKFVIGAEQNGVGYFNYFTGMVDEAFVTKQLFTAGEKTTLYNGGLGLTYPFAFGNALSMASD